jgi:UDP-glucose 4-epimerase
MHRAAHPRRVLVVGWGFLGAATGNRLFDEGADVVGLTRSESVWTDAARTRGIEIVIGDASDPTVVQEMIEGVDQVLFSAGGLPPPAAAVRPRDDLIGRLSALLCVLGCLRRGSKAGITCLSSGGTVYGNPERMPVRETDPLRPVSPYGVSCLAAEAYTEMYGRTYGLPVQIVRCANAYGPGQAVDRHQGAVAIFFDRVSAGLPLRIVGDGEAVRDYVHVDDIASAISRIILERHDVGIVNLGSGRGHRVLELVELVSNVVGCPAVLEFLPARRHDVTSIVLDISKLTSFIDYAPMELSEGLQLTWQGTISPALVSDAPFPKVIRPSTDNVPLPHDAAIS